MLVSQGFGKPFVDVLSAEVASAERVDVATAWVRASGVGLLWDGLAELLARGGTVRIVVGVDRDNTSVEGLTMLLALVGDVRCWVHHNEAGGIFHPKLYAFRTAGDCRVYVGSNNLTGAGLVTNEELSFCHAEKRGGPLCKSVSAYMRAAADGSEGLAKRLDHALIRRLQERGYIDTEARLRGKAANQRRWTPVGARLFGAKAPLRRPIPQGVPAPPDIEPDERTPPADWKRVFIRPRLARRTQGQIPVPVARDVRRRIGATDRDGPISAVMRNTDSVRMISPTYPKRSSSGGANTYKLETFEPRRDIVVKLELIGGQVVIEQLDTADRAGALMDAFIAAGMQTEPVQTIARANLEGMTYAEATRRFTVYRYD